MTIHPAPVAAPSRSAGAKKRPRAWVVTVVVVWVVALAAAGGWALAKGAPTAREQTTVTDALPVVDRAVALIAGAAGVDGQAVAAISGFDRVGDCSITLVRPGERYQRTVTVVVTPGTEAALMRRVAARLPADYRAYVSTGTVARLSGDAGLWVRLSGATVGKGQVQFVADTGACRPRGDLPVAVAPGAAAAAAPAASASPAADSNRAEDAAVLSRLGVPASNWHTFTVACPEGGALTTVEASGAVNVEPGALNEVLRDLGSPVVSTPDAYAYTTGPRHVAVRNDTDHIVVTSTTGC